MKKQKVRILFAVICLAAAFIGIFGIIHSKKDMNSNLPEIAVAEHRENELVFSITLDDYINRFNQLYRKDYRKDYLLEKTEWYSEYYETGIHSPHRTICYDFTEDKEVWTLPTITVYVPSDSENIQEVTINFDDHGYRENMYALYEELCIYTLKVFFPEVNDDTISWLSQMLNNHAYQNMLPHEQGYQYGSVPVLLYYLDGVGVYPYFAEGESMHLCFIPINEKILAQLESQGTLVHNLNTMNEQNTAGLTSDISNSTDAFNSDSLPADELERVQTLCSKIAACCFDLTEDVQWEASPYMPDQMVIAQDSIDRIEQRLVENSYTVLDTDAKYPSYLRNGQAVYDFWKSVQNESNALQNYVWVSPYGGFHLCSLEYRNGTAYFLEAVCEWDGKTISELYKQNVLDWTLTENGNFYYKLHEAHSPAFEDYTLLRLNQPDKTLYELSAKYIEPIGYQNNNLFSSEWSKNDYQAICFNDIFEYLYRQETGSLIEPTALAYQENPFYYQIPAADFEESILPYFDISLQAFREKTCYDKNSNTYPWLDVAYDNLSYFPLITPEVKGYQQNSDGTITLTVDAMCVGLKSDSIFRHELTVFPGDDNGTFQYVSNRIISVSGELPEYLPRLEMQRT